MNKISRSLLGSFEYYVIRRKIILNPLRIYFQKFDKKRKKNLFNVLPSFTITFLFAYEIRFAMVLPICLDVKNEVKNNNKLSVLN